MVFQNYASGEMKFVKISLLRYASITFTNSWFLKTMNLMKLFTHTFYNVLYLLIISFFSNNDSNNYEACVEGVFCSIVSII